MGIAQVLGTFERFDEAWERYVLELGDLLQDAWMDKQHIYYMLENAFRRRTSGLGDRTVWRDLSLPAGLLEVAR